MRPLTAAALTLAAGAASGAASRVLARSPDARAALALMSVLALASCAAAALPPGGPRPAVRAVRGATILAAVFAASWLAAAVAGRPDAAGAALVPASAAGLAFGVASLLRSRGVAGDRCTFGGACVPLALAACVFVADPFVEWNGGGQGSLSRARAVVAASPLASIADGAGIDWQRSNWLYDGPVPGSGGLSVIGQYYPSRPTPAWLWALAAAGAGFAALAAARPRVSIPA